MDVDEFRARLRVLAVDDDHVSLVLVEKQLRLCKYNVTTVMHPEMALEMLRARRDSDDQFDLVITDVHMPEMDGFKLLELIGLEMDIPVIMLSANETLASMMKGIQHGACDYLVKPVCLEQLKRLCIHVGRKVNNDPSNNINNCSDNKGESASGANHTTKCSRKKRKEEDSTREGKKNTSASKRQRIQWSGELHRKFVKVIDQIGIDKAVPKRILDLMNVEGLTREHVASHLQKYRLYMKKLSDGTYRSNNPFTNEALWRQENFINHNLQEHFQHNLEHGRYQTSLSFVAASNSSNPFARMNTPASFGTHSLLPTHSVQLMHQRNLDIPVKDMGPFGYGGSMPQILVPRSQQVLSNFTSSQNSNSNICFPSGPSRSSFANISNSMPFNASKMFPSSTWRNSLASIPSGSSPLTSSMEPRFSPFKSYASLVHGDLAGTSRVNPFDDGNSSKSIEDGEMIPPSSNLLPMHHPQPIAPFGLSGYINPKKITVPSKFLDHGCKDTASEVEPSSGNMHKINRLSRLAASSNEFQNKMAGLTGTTSTPMASSNEKVAPFNIGNNTNFVVMTKDNSVATDASSAISTLPDLQMNNQVVMLSQMVNGGFEDSMIDQRAIGDQHSNNNEFLMTTSSTLNGTNDALDDFFDDLLNQDVLTNDDAFMDGDWDFTP